MQATRVRELMIPLSEYSIVNEEATLYEAVLALEACGWSLESGCTRHRAVLVLDSRHRVVGKVGFFELLQGLEPRYRVVEELLESGSTFTPRFVRRLLRTHGLWQSPLIDMCRKASQTKVKDILYRPVPAEMIPEDSSLEESVHQMIMGRRQSLLVTRKEEVVGVLRLTDVVTKVCEWIKVCGVSSGT